MDGSKITFVSSDGSFSGYAYLHEVGYANEVITAESLNEWLEWATSSEGKLPKLLWQHDWEQPIGVWLECGVDDRGLFLKGRLDMNTEKGREAASLISSGAANGLSLGYEIKRDHVGEDGRNVVDSLRIWECSIVTFPALEEAVIDGVETMTIQMFDTVALDGVRRTNDGYIAANVRCARTGIQVYRGVEVGRPDLAEVRVYRPESEVFNKDSLRTYAHRPMTSNHPPVLVTADNWRKYSIGMTGDEVQRDGEFVRVPMVLMDADAIKEVENGKSQLSLGYTTELKWEPGVTKDGVKYDAIQTQIRANHLAVVTAARGGPNLRIGDDNIKETDNMDSKFKVITVDGISCNMDETSAQVVQKAISDAAAKAASYVADIDGLKKQLADSQTALAAAQAETKKVTETKDAEIDVLKKQVADAAITPEKLEALVKDRTEVVGKALAVLGDSLGDVSKKSIHDIRKAVVDAKMGDVAKNYSEDATKAAFDALTADVKPAAGSADPLANTLRHVVDNKPIVGQDAVDAAYKERDDYYNNAWKHQKAN